MFVGPRSTLPRIEFACSTMGLHSLFYESFWGENWERMDEMEICG